MAANALQVFTQLKSPHFPQHSFVENQAAISRLLGGTPAMIELGRTLVIHPEPLRGKLLSLLDGI